MIDKEMSGKDNMKEKDREKERDRLLSEHVAAITQWIGNLRIVDRRITPTTNRELISDHHRGRWENQALNGSLASLQNEDRVQGDWRPEETERKGSEKEWKDEELLCSSSFK